MISPLFQRWNSTNPRAGLNSPNRFQDRLVHLNFFYRGEVLSDRHLAARGSALIMLGFVWRKCVRFLIEPAGHADADVFRSFGLRYGLASGRSRKVVFRTKIEGDVSRFTLVGLGPPLFKPSCR